MMNSERIEELRRWLKLQDLTGTWPDEAMLLVTELLDEIERLNQLTREMKQGADYTKFIAMWTGI